MENSRRIEAMVAKVLETFGGLPSRGKPQTHEYTTLAAVVVSVDSDAEGGDRDEFAISIAIGTKCVPEKSRCPSGSVVHDSHAEVLVRRTLKRWLCDEMDNLRSGGKSLIFNQLQCSGNFVLKKGVRFHLIISEMPCGDAVILEEQEVELSTAKRLRTGAKPILRQEESGSIKVPTASDVEHYRNSQSIGVVRRKPGKGSPTASVSCSDKIAKWAMLGFQGGILLKFLEQPLYFSSFIVMMPGEEDSSIQGRILSSKKALQRALWQRCKHLHSRISAEGFQRPPQPSIHIFLVQESIMQKHGLVSGGVPSRKVSSGSCTMWWASKSSSWKNKRIFSQIPKDKSHCEVIIGKLGVKLGLSRSKIDGQIDMSCRVPASGRSRVCRFSMQEVITQMFKSLEGQITSHSSYYEMKKSVSPLYYGAWEALQASPSILSDWIPKN